MLAALRHRPDRFLEYRTIAFIYFLLAGEEERKYWEWWIWESEFKGLLYTTIYSGAESDPLADDRGEFERIWVYRYGPTYPHPLTYQLRWYHRLRVALTWWWRRLWRRLPLPLPPREPEPEFPVPGLQKQRTLSQEQLFAEINSFREAPSEPLNWDDFKRKPKKARNPETEEQ